MQQETETVFHYTEKLVAEQQEASQRNAAILRVSRSASFLSSLIWLWLQTSEMLQ